MSSFVSHMMTGLIGIVYPAYFTYKAAKNKSEGQRLLWLRYWVTFAAYYSITAVSDQFNITKLDSEGGLVEIKPVASNANQTEIVNAVSCRCPCAEHEN